MKKQIKMRWDFTKLAACLQSGVGRIAYLEELEREFVRRKESFEAEKGKQAPDDHWALWMKTVQEVGQRYFAKSEKQSYCTPEYEQMKDQRDQLIRAEEELKVSLAATSDGHGAGSELAARWRLLQIQKSMRGLRRQMRALTRKTLVFDLEEARNKKDKAGEHRIVRLLAGNGIAKKKRPFLHCPAFRPSCEELEEFAKSPAVEGQLPSSFHAYRGRSRRESAMLVVRIVSEELSKNKISNFCHLRDMTNAFACTGVSHRERAMSEIYDEEHLGYVRQHVRNATVFLSGCNGEICVELDVGNCIGSCEGPIMFCLPYRDVIESSDLRHVYRPCGEGLFERGDRSEQDLLGEGQGAEEARLGPAVCVHGDWYRRRDRSPAQDGDRGKECQGVGGVRPEAGGCGLEAGVRMGEDAQDIQGVREGAEEANDIVLTCPMLQVMAERWAREQR